MPNSDTTPSRARLRAKRACKTCNARRVRCNVVESQPCTNCRAANISCELMQSRRGKYERHPNSTRAPSQSTPSFVEPAQSTQGFGETATPASINSVLYSPGAQDQDQKQKFARTYSDSGVPKAKGSFNLGDQARNGISPIFPITSPDGGSSSERAGNGADSTVYLGESASISLVHEPEGSINASPIATGDKKRLRYPIPEAMSSQTSTSPVEIRRKAARIEYLAQEGAFKIPSAEVCELLFTAYFSWFHPCFPIIDRYAFSESYLSKTISPLLLQAVLFVGATHCNEKTLRSVGLTDRHDARTTLYNRAKDIYDADYETDKIIVSQALFLMSFWRSGPILEKDTRHWLGAAISLTQTKGMHRSSSNTNLSDAKLRKRIWWSLYVRDRQCAAALGLPTRIRDEDCDIEMLEISDFDEEKPSSDPEFVKSQKMEHILYAIQMAKLAKMLGRIVLREFAPRNDSNKDTDKSKLNDDLMDWESKLSPEMSSNSTSRSFWASALHISYNNLYILLYRSAYLGAQEGDAEDKGQMALTAACRNTRIVEDMLSQNLIQHGNVHLTTSLFNSLCIHTINLRRSENTARKLAEYRAQICLLGLRELQSTWDVTNWVLQLYFQYLDQSIVKKLQMVDTEDVPSRQSSTDSPTTKQNSYQGSEGAMVPQESSLAGHTELEGYGSGGIRPSAQPRQLVGGLDFASQIFGSQEAEDFSMFQLLPDLFNGAVFGGDLDQYYSSMSPRADGMMDMNAFGKL